MSARPVSKTAQKPLRVTRRRLLIARACYTRKHIEALVPRSGLTIRQVLALPRVPKKDKIWAITSASGMSRTQLFELARFMYKTKYDYFMAVLPNSEECHEKCYIMLKHPTEQACRAILADSKLALLHPCTRIFYRYFIATILSSLHDIRLYSYYIHEIHENLSCQLKVFDYLRTYV